MNAFPPGEPLSDATETGPLLPSSLVDDHRVPLAAQVRLLAEAYVANPTVRGTRRRASRFNL